MGLGVARRNLLLANVLVAVAGVGLAGAQPVRPGAPVRSGTGAASAPQPLVVEGMELHRGITVPSATVELTLNIPRVAREVPVKPGDRVKVGDLLLQEEDADEVARLDILKHLAETNIPLQAAEVTLKHRQAELKRIRQMFDQRVANPVELEKAELDVALAALEVDKAKFEKAQAQMEVRRQEELLKQMRIVSPFDAVVQDTPVLKGEVVDPQRPAMVLVKIDPVWVHVHIPSAKAAGLQIGQELGVYYPGEQKPVMGKIIYKDPMVDATADVQLVRLELTNAESRPAGLRIQVALPKDAPAAAAAAR